MSRRRHHDRPADPSDCAPRDVVEEGRSGLDGGSAYRRVLRNRALVRLLFGEFVSSIGDWLYLVAIMVVVYQVTSDPVVLGIVGAARLLPFVLLSVPAGHRGRPVRPARDPARHGRRCVACSWSCSRCSSRRMRPVVGHRGRGRSWPRAPARSSGRPSARTCPIVVADERDLGPANSLWATLDNLAYFIGPAIAGPAHRRRWAGLGVPAQRGVVRGRRGRARHAAAGSAERDAPSDGGPSGARRDIGRSRGTAISRWRAGAPHRRRPSSWTPRPASRASA